MRNSAEHSVRIDREVTADVLHDTYDFIVCGGGTAGSVLARRLSDNPQVSVLLLEAGGSDRVPMVIDSTQWMWNIGTERDWQFQAAPSPSLNGRTPPLPMGRVLGGGSSINGSVWARGHRTDFDMWAEETDDPAERDDKAPTSGSLSEVGLALKSAAIQSGQYDAFKTVMKLMHDQHPELARGLGF